MIEKLTTTISENWNTFSRVLNIELKNKPENYLLMINEVKPYIKLLDKIIERPNPTVRILQMKIGNLEYVTLIEMGFLNYNSENESFDITRRGIEVSKGLYYVNHPEALEEEKRRRELRKYIIEETPSF